MSLLSKTLSNQAKRPDLFLKFDQNVRFRALFAGEKTAVFTDQKAHGAHQMTSRSRRATFARQLTHGGPEVLLCRHPALDSAVNRYATEGVNFCRVTSRGRQ